MKRFKDILSVYIKPSVFNQLPGDETTPKRPLNLAQRNSARLTVVEANEDFGNTAETVLRQVECPVLTVKPAGFETPVTLQEGL